MSRRRLSGRSNPPRFRHLCAEQLETRRLLTITVNTLVDEADGSIVDGDVSLRDAIALAAPGDTIDFSVTGTIVLSLGVLTVDKDLTIDGPGAELLTIDASGNDPTPADDNGDGTPVFYVNINRSVLVDGFEISSLTLTGGDSGGNGGAIATLSGISLRDVHITDNAARYRGGGVYVLTPSGAATSIVDTVFSSNTSRDGGGLYLDHVGSNSTNFIEGCTFVGNTAGRDGGGLYNVASAATLAISNSTFVHNHAETGGGLILFQIGATTTIFNSTISQNAADDNGGGLSNYSWYDDGTTLRHVTITGNSANGVQSGVGGGGIHNRRLDVSMSVEDSIVAGNMTGAGANVPDVWGSILASHSLIGIDTGATVVDLGGNMVGTALAPIDPMLGPLASNGGATQTHALLLGSPAIDAATSNMDMMFDHDQRGGPFVRQFGVAADMGAYERQTVAPLSLVVDSSDDASDGDYSTDNLTLREAIEMANGSIGPNLITFAPTLDQEVVLLRNGELLVTDETTIDATMLPSGLTIDAAGNDPTPLEVLGDGTRALNVDGATADGLAALVLRGVTLTGGDVDGDGGALRSVGNLTLDGVTVVDSHATRLGGGVFFISTLGDLSIVDTSISNNDAVQSGGGIFVNAQSGTKVTIDDSLIVGNAAGTGGGASLTAFDATVAFNGSTVSGNVAHTSGGGLSVNAAGGGLAMLSNSTVVDNLAEDGDGGGMRSYAAAGGEIRVVETTISGNSATDNGGGISALTYDGITSIDRSTISQNEIGADDGILASSSGGGAYLAARQGGVVTVTDSTVSENVTENRGGGVFIWSTNQADVRLDRVTISANVSYQNASGIDARSRT
ncbi:MAG: hypothetical protein KDA63_16600, partial [Planctomycetales bacterium]|nr:hypothetical protein [Planctomycetales bacterium]